MATPTPEELAGRIEGLTAVLVALVKALGKEPTVRAAMIEALDDVAAPQLMHQSEHPLSIEDRFLMKTLAAFRSALAGHRPH